MFDKFGRGVITWRELSSLTKALGIPDIPLGLLHRIAAEFTPDNSVGLDYKAFLHLLLSDSFAESLDYTYNRHNSTYNIRVIRKSLAFLVEGFLSLEDLRSARMGFTLYEGETCNGIQLDASVVSAAMRVTGKAIAPKKLQAWLDAVEEDVPGRLQLYEFLELVKLCNDRSDLAKSVPNTATSIERSRIGLFELTDPNFLLTPGQKLSKQMDEDYESMVSTMNSQQMLPRETAATSKTSNSDFHNFAAKHARRNKRVDESLDLYSQIRESIKSTTAHVNNARAMNTSAPSSRPRTVSGERTAQLPTLHLSSSLRPATRERRSTSAPSFRSMESQKTSRLSDAESVTFDSKLDRDKDSLPRHLSLRSPHATKEKVEGTIDNAEVTIPDRKMDNYETLRDYLTSNGEASLSRIITSSIGASYKHTSPPSSPDAKLEDRRKKKNKRGNAKNLQSIYRDRLSKGSPAAALEEMFAKVASGNAEGLAKMQSMRKPVPPPTEDPDPSNNAPSNVSEENARSRPRTSHEGAATRITFQLQTNK